MNKPVKARVIEVKGSDIRVVDPFTCQRADYGNFVRVRQVDGCEHVFFNGSLNAVPEELRKVGQEGFITWMKSASYNLPVFGLGDNREANQTEKGKG